MRKYWLAMTIAVGLIAATFSQLKARPVAAQMGQQSTAVFDSQGRLKLPNPAVFRRWVFVGAPLTPNGLNDGKANFPEYHHVYVEERNLKAYLKTGSFPEGTMFVKELARVLQPTFPDGSTTEPSGRGFFDGQYNGIDVTVKDSKRFPNTNSWGFFTFGHHPEPYAEWATESPASECGSCHMTYVSKTDMTWIQFYPILRDKTLYPIN